MLKIEVVTSDVLEFQCDVLVLKYAQAFFGADLLVSRKMAGLRDASKWAALLPGEHLFLNSLGRLPAGQILVMGVVPLNSFDYGEIRSFAKQALETLLTGSPSVRHVAMTVHGVGIGLDEREAFLAQLGGVAEAVTEFNTKLHISIVEKDPRRSQRLRKLLDETWFSFNQVGQSGSAKRVTQEITAGIESKSKAHVFVAMPFNKELEDVFIFGIQGPVHGAGYLCERVDMVSFRGMCLSA